MSPRYFEANPTGPSGSDKRTTRIASVQKLERSRRKPVASTKILRAGAPPKARKPPRKRNPKRANENHERAYGEYATLIRAMPCAACGYSAEPSDAAHATNGGMSKKSDAKWLVPLCKPHNVTATWGKVRLYEGCHKASHRGIKTFEKDSGLNLKALAAELWAAHGGEA